MSEEARTYAQTKHFSAPTLERWLALPAADRDALLEIANRLRLGENHFRDVLDLADDIAARQQTTIQAVLASASVRELLGRGHGRNETLKELKDVLRRRRYPQLAATEAALAVLVKQLGLPPEVRIDFPENLDGNGIVVTLRAKSASELRVCTRALAAVCMRTEVDEMFNRLEGAS